MIELNGKTHKEKDFLNFVLKTLTQNLQLHEQAINILDEANEFLKQGRKDKNKKSVIQFKEMTKYNAERFKEDIIKAFYDNETLLAEKILDQSKENRKLKLKIRALEEQIRVYEGTQGEEEPINQNEEKQENTEKE